MLLLLLSVNHAHLNQLFISVQHFQVQHLNNVKPFSGSSLRPSVVFTNKRSQAKVYVMYFGISSI